MPITKERMKEVVEAARGAIDAAGKLRAEVVRLSAEDLGNQALLILLHGSLEDSFKVREAELVIREEEKWLSKFWNKMEKKKKQMVRRRLRDRVLLESLIERTEEEN